MRLLVDCVDNLFDKKSYNEALVMERSLGDNNCKVARCNGCADQSHGGSD